MEGSVMDMINLGYILCFSKILIGASFWLVNEVHYKEVGSFIQPSALLLIFKSISFSKKDSIILAIYEGKKYWVWPAAKFYYIYEWTV